ncbi:hypothetical protein MAPG_00026 [Magnaporthiopsis poae ATCC 64411]|uniref:Thioredoxin domain-containing protein n=1 Tax=Magnaporthiopsis poae (strain ATCC 64411 / 73-15) TaxID=644358 RepID=A0A0C4DJW7_MAGP6|nr:hypothetical protein MAPG_00026 [Magnaporthiopsis poae ATCC 64411]
MAAIPIVTSEELDEAKRDENKKTVLIAFFAEWCGPCHAMNPTLEKFSKRPDFREIHFRRVDVDEDPGLMKRFEVSAMPTFVIVEDGEAKDRSVGANPQALQAMLDKAAAEIKKNKKAAEENGVAGEDSGGTRAAPNDVTRKTGTEQASGGRKSDSDGRKT